jgi:predicted nucleic acid-binding protein
MADKIFLDTNIIIYCYSQDELDKQQCALECVQLGNSWISTQVLNETVNTLRRKFSLDYAQIGAVVDELTQQLQVATVSVNTIQIALAISQRYQYSYFDSLIIASSLEVGCDRLYSEDLQDGQQIEDKLTIINPFLPILH